MADNDAPQTESERAQASIERGKMISRLEKEGKTSREDIQRLAGEQGERESKARRRSVFGDALAHGGSARDLDRDKDENRSLSNQRQSDYNRSNELASRGYYRKGGKVRGKAKRGKKARGKKARGRY